MLTHATLPFPTLHIHADACEAQGRFAESQAAFLHPDSNDVQTLTQALERTHLGIVAHFYMDPELQGLLHATSWPHVFVADSLKMADAALTMAQAGVKGLVVLGVDFMSENVRALLDRSGFADLPVYRVAAEPIGCTLAESADAPAYTAYLKRAAAQPKSLHVIYVNTSLSIKGTADQQLPTITCTSSNVLQTLLQAAAQVPELHLWFGPDTYMGQNLQHLLRTLSQMDPKSIRQLHPEHTPDSIASLVERFHFFEQGACMVHHMFGHKVVQKIRQDYPDALVTAHLEVPGEMFALGLEAQQQKRGVVGSTSNILNFIRQRITQAPTEEHRWQFILGTEAGMITPIVHAVQDLLKERSHQDVVEIVFPVADEAIAPTEDTALPVLPGTLHAEGCSTAGGCATCPFMKMNSRAAMMQLLDEVQTPADLSAYKAKRGATDENAAQLVTHAGNTIVAMRHLQQHGRLSDTLLQRLNAGS